MKIPKDTGGMWRWNKFMEYHALGDADMNFPVLRKWADDKGLDQEERIWMSLFYSCCYCVPTTVFLMSKLPSIRTVKSKDVEEVWRLYKQQMVFQSDRKYVKNMDWFPTIVGNFVRLTKRDAVGWVESHIDGNRHPLAMYNAFYKDITGWRYFGRFSAFLMIESLAKLADVNMDADWFDWKNGNTATEGMMHILYMDKEAAEFKHNPNLSAETVKLLSDKLSLLRRQISAKYPDVSTAIVDIETSLCGFRKLFKQSRYAGYYIDRQQEEILKMQQSLPDYDFGCLWDARRKVFNNVFLGELNGWVGIRKELYTQWTEKGLTGVETIGKS